MKNFKNVIIFLLGNLFCLICVVFFNNFIASDDYIYKDYIILGNKIVKEIEDYKLENGNYPESLLQVGVIDDIDSIYHYNVYGNEFELSFGTIIGESLTYSSKDERWE